MDLQPRVPELEAGKTRAGAGLKALAAGNPGVHAPQRAGERFYLADFAAAVRIIGPAQAGLVLVGDDLRARLNDPQLLKPKAGGKIVPIGKRLGKHLECVDEDTRERKKTHMNT